MGEWVHRYVPGVGVMYLYEEPEKSKLTPEEVEKKYPLVGYEGGRARYLGGDRVGEAYGGGGRAITPSPPPIHKMSVTDPMTGKVHTVTYGSTQEYKTVTQARRALEREIHQPIQRQREVPFVGETVGKGIKKELVKEVDGRQVLVSPYQPERWTYVSPLTGRTITRATKEQAEKELEEKTLLKMKGETIEKPAVRGTFLKESFEKGVKEWEEFEEKLRKATTYKYFPTPEEQEKAVREGKWLGTGLLAMGVEKLPESVKETELAYERGAYGEFYHHPLKATTIGVASFGIGAVGATGVVPHVPIISPMIKYGVPTTYAGYTGLRVHKAPTTEAKAEEVGRIVTGEIAPVIIGGGLGIKVGTAYRQWKTPVFEFKVYEDIAPREIHFREVGGELKPEWRVGAPRVYERAIEPTPETARAFLKASAKEWVVGIKYVKPEGIQKTPFKSTFPKTIYMAPETTEAPSIVTSGKQALELILEPKVTTKVTPITKIAPEAPSFIEFKPLKGIPLLRWLESLEVSTAKPLAISFPIEKGEAKVTPVEVTKTALVMGVGTSPISKIGSRLKTDTSQIAATRMDLGLGQIGALKTIARQAVVQKSALAQKTALKQVPIQLQIQRLITPQKPMLRPPITFPVLGFPKLGAMKFKPPKIDVGFKTFKFRVGIRPLAGLLSLTRVEAKLLRKARHPPATPKIKKQYLKAMRGRPWAFEFPTWEQMKGLTFGKKKKRKKKRRR